MRPRESFSRLYVTSRFTLALIFLVLAGCSGLNPRPSYPPGYPIGFIERGVASWYGPGFNGNRTANGERYDMHKLTAAHRTLPLGSIAVVHSLTNGRHITVRINDRGPFAGGRILDLSLAGAQALAMTGAGTDRVELRVIGYQGKEERLGALRVQVASFTESANAQALLDRLKRRYANSRIVVADLAGGRRYRVQVGDFATETQAEAAADQLEADLDVEAFIVRDDT